jgi:hypothetical protein
MSEQQAIREYIVRKVTLIIDNTQELYWPVRQAAIDAAQHDMGTGWDREDFLEMLAGRGRTDLREVAEVVGIAVCDVIGEWLDLNDPLHGMLADLLDLNDREQGVMFGAHFMPEADDWPADE